MGSLQATLAVGAGGFLGSIGRYWIGQLLSQRSESFPWATLLVNTTGCLLIGILLGYFTSHTESEMGRLFLVIGFLGGFTTFSTFSAETIHLMQSGKSAAAGGYIAASLICSLLATFLGKQIVSAFSS